MGKMFFNILATFAEFEADLISMPPASVPSAISPSSSPSQDQPSIAHSTGAFPLSVRSLPLTGIDLGNSDPGMGKTGIKRMLAIRLPC